jgi:hypothetical protein
MMLRRRWRGNTFRSWRDRLLERYDSIASDRVSDLGHEELLGAFERSKREPDHIFKVPGAAGLRRVEA